MLPASNKKGKSEFCFDPDTLTPRGKRIYLHANNGGINVKLSEKQRFPSSLRKIREASSCFKRNGEGKQADTTPERIGTFLCSQGSLARKHRIKGVDNLVSHLSPLNCYAHCLSGKMGFGKRNHAVPIISKPFRLDKSEFLGKIYFYLH